MMKQMQKELVTLKGRLEKFKTECKVKNLTKDTLDYYKESLAIL